MSNISFAQKLNKFLKPQVIKHSRFEKQKSRSHSEWIFGSIIQRNQGYCSTRSLKCSSQLSSLSKTLGLLEAGGAGNQLSISLARPCSRILLPELSKSNFSPEEYLLLATVVFKQASVFFFNHVETVNLFVNLDDNDKCCSCCQ